MDSQNSGSIKSNINIHLIWIIGVLLAFGVWNFSITWGGSKQVVESLSLATAIASLIVGVYAIFQGLYSGSSANDAAAGLRSSATQVSEAATRVEQASQSLTGKMDAFPIRFDEIGEKIESLKQARELEQEAARTYDDTTSGADIDISHVKVGELISLYVCLLSRQNHKYFNCVNMFSADSTKYYTQGYIRAMILAGAVDGQENDDKELIITDMKKFSAEQIVERLDVSKKSYVTNHRSAVEAYFSRDTD